MNLQELSEQVISKANIIDIIGEVVELKQQKGGHWGLCPFHNDTHASMSVIDRDNKKMFNCFSCGEKGNVISFYSKYYGVSYGQATIKLAIKLGIPVENNLLSDNDRNDSLYKAMEEACNFYQFYLLNSTESKEALEYLKNRGITEEIIKEFRIGLAPSSNDDLHVTLNNLKISELDQIELGLVNTNNNGKVYDLFRKRIMFPIINQYNKIVGFSGRTFLEEQKNESKYINSKETKIFHKGNILYNFHNAQKAARAENFLYVFEGFMDVIAGYKAGIINSVAAMGTAFTEEHVKKILNTSKNVVLCFDGDEAGINALRKTVALFSRFNIIPDAVILPNGMDPDEYLNKFGKDALLSYLKINHKNALEILYENSHSLIKENDLMSFERFKTSVFDSILTIGQSTIIEYYLKKLSEDLNIELDLIRNDFSSYSRHENRNQINNFEHIQNEPRQVVEEIKPIKKEIIVKKKHVEALNGIIAEMFKDRNRFEQCYSKLGENMYHICNELALHTAIIYELNCYYNELNDLNIPRYFVNSPDLLSLNPGSPAYNLCLEILNRIEYKGPSNEKGFYENIECIKTLINDLNHQEFKEEFVNNKDTNNVKRFVKHKKENTKIVKKIKKG